MGWDGMGISSREESLLDFPKNEPLTYIPRLSGAKQGRAERKRENSKRAALVDAEAGRDLQD